MVNERPAACDCAAGGEACRGGTRGALTASLSSARAFAAYGDPEGSHAAGLDGLLRCFAGRAAGEAGGTRRPEPRGERLAPPMSSLDDANVAGGGGVGSADSVRRDGPPGRAAPDEEALGE